MPDAYYEMNPANRITVGAIGLPGKRTFYLQAQQGQRMISLLVEKDQVQALAAAIEETLQELSNRYPDLAPERADIAEQELNLQEPTVPEFRVGQMALGYDESHDLLVLVAQELAAEETEKPAVARFWATRGQMRALGRHGLNVAAAGRPICPHCGAPIDPEGHFCPKRNGHGGWIV